MEIEKEINEIKKEILNLTKFVMSDLESNEGDEVKNYKKISNIAYNYYNEGIKNGHMIGYLNLLILKREEKIFAEKDYEKAKLMYLFMLHHNLRSGTNFAQDRMFYERWFVANFNKKIELSKEIVDDNPELQKQLFKLSNYWFVLNELSDYDNLNETERNELIMAIEAYMKNNEYFKRLEGVIKELKNNPPAVR
jgi:hypothetical protein